MTRAALTLAALAAVAVASPHVVAQGTAIPKVLYLTQSVGYKHEVLPLSEQILTDLGKRTGGFEVTVSQDASRINAETLKPYSAVVFYTTGELPMSEAQKADLMAFVKGGKGFVGVHSATDTFYKWAEYGEMIGGYFDEHPWNTTVTMKVETHATPMTRHLGKTWTIADEIYQFKNYSRADKHVLLSLVTSSVDLKVKGVKRTDGDFANAWHRDWGKGRVFYTALGHRPEVWQDKDFQQHLVGGIQWAMKTAAVE
jgi:hypothetical protein